MASSQIGMNTDSVAHQMGQISSYTSQLDGLAEQASATASEHLNPWLAGGISLLSPVLGGGAVATHFVLTEASRALVASAVSDIRFASASAADLIGRLGVNIAEQTQASSATDGYLDGLISQQQADQLVKDVLADPSALDGMTPQQVQAWWARLTDAQKNELMENRPEVIGNTNGVPFDVRVEANQRNAETALQNTKGMTPEQIEYLNEVADGDRTLISFDPENDRIIEMVGTLDENTQNIVNYVPGTAATMDGFYQGTTQEVGQYLVDNAVPPGSTVAFIYKDSPFPTFNPDGVYNSSWSAEVGNPYHNFNTALSFENPGGIPVTSIEHSFASSVGGYAETQGTVFDQRIVLGGIGMSEDWKPNPGTDYTSFTGPSDIIREAREKYSDDLNTGYPYPPTTENGFTERETGIEPWNPGPGGWVIGNPDPVQTGPNPIDQHTQVAGTEDNQVVLDQILDLL